MLTSNVSTRTVFARKSKRKECVRQWMCMWIGCVSVWVNLCAWNIFRNLECLTVPLGPFASNWSDTAATASYLRRHSLLITHRDSVLLSLYRTCVQRSVSTQSSDQNANKRWKCLSQCQRKYFTSSDTSVRVKETRTKRKIANHKQSNYRTRYKVHYYYYFLCGFIRHGVRRASEEFV